MACRRAEEVYKARVTGRLAANHSATLLRFAQAGQGIALLASWLVDPLIEAGALAALMPEHAAPPAPIQALTPPTPHRAPRVTALLDFLIERLRPLGLEGDQGLNAPRRG